jgi:CheY-like chemotaxis protein
MQEVIKRWLESLDYRILTATNGREALEVYDRHRAEIALVEPISALNLGNIFGALLGGVLAVVIVGVFPGRLRMWYRLEDMPAILTLADINT